jgi:MoaA/NifB/PqqE/SkfB family radical SAM enzyme
MFKIRRMTLQSYLLRNIFHSEPRVELIKKQLESILKIVQLEKNGQTVEVDGFRLRNLGDWLIQSDDNPDNILCLLATNCNANCIFCYTKGDPPEMRFDSVKRSSVEEFEEVKTRIKYYSPELKTQLFYSHNEVYEVLLHPHLFETLELLRQKTSAPFLITTNGMVLKAGFVKRLSNFKPIMLTISLNSADIERRKRIMNDKHPEVAINALPLLKAEEIPFNVTIVAWPENNDISSLLKDIYNTVLYADSYDPYCIMIHLPGYSKFFSETKLFDTEDVWSKITYTVRSLREKISTPVFVAPILYEENLYYEQLNKPEIKGVVKGSPAAKAGLKRGDLILEVDGFKVDNRASCSALLRIIVKNKETEISILVNRNEKNIEFKINPKDFLYPHSQIGDNLGILMLGEGFGKSNIKKIREIIEKHNPKSILFLSSRLVKPTFQQELAKSGILEDLDVEFYIEIPENRTLGGNIFMGDLLLVDDFIYCIKKFITENKKPDLVIIPSTPFTPWGRDLMGRTYPAIERTVGVNVELLDAPQMGFSL